MVGLDAKGLDGGVVDLQAGDEGGLQRVRGEELRLSLAALVAAEAVPPPGAVAIDLGAGVLLDGDVGARDGD